jgi:hypothetical protein
VRRLVLPTATSVMSVGGETRLETTSWATLGVIRTRRKGNSELVVKYQHTERTSFDILLMTMSQSNLEPAGTRPMPARQPSCCESLIAVSVVLKSIFTDSSGHGIRIYVNTRA